MTPKISEIKIIFLVCFFIVIIIVELIREPSSPNWAEKQANAWLEEQIAIIVAERCAESEEKEACIEDFTKALEISEETEKFISAMEKKLGGPENVYQKTDEEMRELRREYEAELEAIKQDLN